MFSNYQFLKLCDANVIYNSYSNLFQSIFITLPILIFLLNSEHWIRSDRGSQGHSDHGADSRSHKSQAEHDQTHCANGVFYHIG